MKFDILPTDSLYKFMSIFGLLAAIFTLSYPVKYSAELHDNNEKNIQKISEIQIESIKLLTEMKEILVFNDFTNFEIKKFKISGLSSADHINNSNGKNLYTYKYYQFNSKIKSVENDSIRELLNKLNIKYAQSRCNYINNKRSIKHNFDSLEVSITLYFILGAFSLIIMFLGIVFWYTKEQKYKDKLIRHKKLGDQ